MLRSALILSALSLTLLGGSAAFAATAPPADATIVASNFQFAPNTLTLHVNVPETVTFRSKEGVHGVASADLGIPQTVLPPGVNKTVTFTPKKIGTFVVHCTVPCGAGHATMLFTVTVVA